MSSRDFEFDVIGLPDWDRVNDNVDVEITLRDGRRFVATFFTIENVKTLLEKYKDTGECASGLYFWATDMILVETLTLDVIERTIADLIQEKELELAISEADLHSA